MYIYTYSYTCIIYAYIDKYACSYVYCIQFSVSDYFLSKTFLSKP